MQRRRRNHRRGKNHTVRNIVISCFVMTLLFATGYSAFQTVISINAKGNIVRDEECVVGKVWEFSQKDESQEFRVPCTGTYKLETWGAEGGAGKYSIYSHSGGYGGYSTGTIILARGKVLFVNVGGQGTSANISGSAKGGYNGGGDVLCNDEASSNKMSGSGGGLTHISFKNDILKELENEKSSVALVAGGGGGGKSYHNNNYSGIGGHGGGYIGGNGTPDNQTVYGYGTGGTQASGGGVVVIDLPYGETSGKFGQGAIVNYPYGGYYLSGPGGGGGWYGGGSIEHGPAGGGSGYIGNPSLTDKSMYCYDCEESLDLTKPEIFTVSTTGSSNYRDNINCANGYSETPISKCAKKGGGFAKITLISRN